MTRLPDWQSRLQALVSARLHAPFVWGSNDCFTFALDAVEAITGEARGAELRRYTTEQGAAKVIKRTGGMAAGGDECFGERIAPALAQVGDIALVLNAGRECFAVCGGSHWTSTGPDGLESAPMSAAVLAWRAC